MSFLSVNNIAAGYGRDDVIKDVSFNLDKGLVMGVLGANGSGKTTLLKAMCNVLPHKGVCTLDNTNLGELSVKRLAQLVSYIPQRSGITIDVSVLDVVLMGFNPQLGILEHPSSEMKKDALQIIEKVGLSGKESVNYQLLSEGQKQLCIMARTLVSSGKLLLLDEPESSLDFHFRYNMLSLVKNHVAAADCCAVVTLHDPTLALNYCDSLLILSNTGSANVLEMKNASTDIIEKELSKIYGNVSIHKCINRQGLSQIIMLKED